MGVAQPQPLDGRQPGGGDGEQPALVDAVGLAPEQTVSAWLNHGNHVAVVGPQHLGTALHETDAMISATPGLALSMRFADCVPVLFHDAARGVIAIAHAGWPGVAAGIVGKTVRAMQETFGCRPRDVWAGIGPAIRVECYDFGRDLAQRVVAACPPGVPVVVPQPDGSASPRPDRRRQVATGRGRREAMWKTAAFARLAIRTNGSRIASRKRRAGLAWCSD